MGEGGDCSIKDNAKSQEIIQNQENKLYFTYEVQWEQSDIRWASRWDIYLTMADVQIHWFSIINSVVVVFFLSSIITMIIIRTLRRDIAKYNTEDDLEESIEETGWKLVHGDIFRPPNHTRIFAAVIGSGIQLFCMMAISIFVYEFMGLVAGYFAGRLYKTLKGKHCDGVFP